MTCNPAVAYRRRVMDDVFKALADSSRRKLLDELFKSNGQTLGDRVGETFPGGPDQQRRNRSPLGFVVLPPF